MKQCLLKGDFLIWGMHLLHFVQYYYVKPMHRAAQCPKHVRLRSNILRIRMPGLHEQACEM
mgnify:CR=1 FL=1